MSFERRGRSSTKNFIKQDKMSKVRLKILSLFSRLSNSRRLKRRLSHLHSRLRFNLPKSFNQGYLISPVRYPPSRAFYVSPTSLFFVFFPLVRCRLRAANDHLCPLQH